MLDPILRRNLGHHHSEDVYWISPRVLAPIHMLWLHESTRRSCTQSAFLERTVGFLTRCSSTFTYLRNATCSWEAFSMKTLSVRPASRSPARIDWDVINSSTDFSFSTSLIHCIVRQGSATFEHTSVLKLTFQLWTSMGFREFSKMYVLDKKSRVFLHTTVNISSTSIMVKYYLHCEG